MAKFEITAPDGKKYRVTGDNAEGAYAALMQHLGTGAAPKSDFDGTDYTFPSPPDEPLEAKPAPQETVAATEEDSGIRLPGAVDAPAKPTLPAKPAPLAAPGADAAPVLTDPLMAAMTDPTDDPTTEPLVVKINKMLADPNITPDMRAMLEERLRGIMEKRPEEGRMLVPAMGAPDRTAAAASLDPNAARAEPSASAATSASDTGGVGFKARHLGATPTLEDPHAARAEKPIDPFYGEGAAALLKRRGQQFARGATEIFATIPEALAIMGASADQTRKEGAASTAEDRQLIIQDITEKLKDPNLDPETKAFLEQNLADYSQGQIVLGGEAAKEVVPAKDRPMFAYGDKVREASANTFGAPDARDTGFWGKVAEGSGSVAAFASSALVPGGVVAKTATGAALGSETNMASMYSEAIDAGADEETAQKAAKWGALIGAGEIIPINRALKILPRNWGPKVTNWVMKGFVEIAESSGEEAAQEWLSQVANNWVAKELYDPERGWMQGANENALIGAITGGALAATGTLRGDPESARAPVVAPDRRKETPSPQDELAAAMGGAPVVPPPAAKPVEKLVDKKAAAVAALKDFAAKSQGAGMVPGSEPARYFDKIVADAEKAGMTSDEIDAALAGDKAPPLVLTPKDAAPAAAPVVPEPPKVAPKEAAVAPKDETTAPADFEIMDEVETVDGEERPTGRKVRVNLNTGDAEVVEDGDTGAEVGGDGVGGRGAPEETQAVAAKAETPPAEPSNKTPTAAPAPSAPDPEFVGDRPPPVRKFLTHDETLAIKTNPKVFQYKGGADTEGVTDALRNIRGFDPNRAGQLVLFERKDGTLEVADGHQRTGLARRAAEGGQADVGGAAATIYREADGYTAEEVMGLAALKNIGEGSGSAVDAARILRTRSESIADLGLPPNSALVRKAEGIRRLGDDAFGMVANGVASEEHGDVVGRNVPDKALQADILAMLTREKPDNLAQAAMIARDAASTATTETQTDMFGTLQVQKSLYVERAKVLDAAMKSQGIMAKTFRNLIDREGMITAAGNKLDADANAAQMDEAGKIRQYLQSQANMKGPISDALTKAAEAVRSGTPVARAADGFVKDVKSALQGGGEGSTPPAGGRAPDEVKPEDQQDAVAPDPDADLFGAMMGTEKPAASPPATKTPSDDLFAAMGGDPAQTGKTPDQVRAEADAKVKAAQSKKGTTKPQADAGPLFDDQADIEKPKPAAPVDLIAQGRETLKPYWKPEDQSYNNQSGIDLRKDPMVVALAEKMAKAKTAQEREKLADDFVLEQGMKDMTEYLVVLGKGGEILAVMKGSRSNVSLHAAVWRAIDDGKAGYATHNHPGSGDFSGNDLMIVGMGVRVAAMAHDGRRHVAEPVEGAIPKTSIIAGDTGPFSKAASILTELRDQVWVAAEPLTTAWELTGKAARLAILHRGAFSLILDRLGVIKYSGATVDDVAAVGIDFGELYGRASSTFADRLGRAGFKLTESRDQSGDRPADSGAGTAQPAADSADQGTALPDGQGDGRGRVPEAVKTPDDFDTAANDVLDDIFGTTPAKTAAKPAKRSDADIAKDLGGLFNEDPAKFMSPMERRKAKAKARPARQQDLFDMLNAARPGERQIDLEDYIDEKKAADRDLFGFGEDIISTAKYAQAVPLFREILAGQDVTAQPVIDTIRAVAMRFKDNGLTRDGIERMLPYLKLYLADVRDGKLTNPVEDGNAPGPDSNLEPDRGDATSGDRLGQDGLPASAGGPGGRGGRGGNAPDAGDGKRDGGDGLPAGDAASVGTQGNPPVQGGIRGKPGAAVDRDGAGSRDRGEQRPSPDSQPATHTEQYAVETAPAAVASRQAQQAEADKKTKAQGVKWADEASVRQSLPLLKPEQQDDVIKIEKRFAKPNGHGMLITNGTGTGKTYSGGGQIKRFVQAGKNNILIVAPSQGILDHWERALADMGIEASRLDDTKSSGKGVTLTTYANMGENETLADRDWDLVVTDEAHKLSQNADGDATAALQTLRAITNRPADRQKASMMRRRAEWAKALAMPDSDVKTSALNRLWALARQDAEAMATKPRAKVLFLSATPFAYVKNTDYAEGYLFDYPSDGVINGSRQPGRNLFMVENFGMRIRYHKLTQPDVGVDTGVFEREFHEKMRRDGVLSGRMLDIDADYDRLFVMSESAEGAKIDEILQFISDQANAKGEDQRTKDYRALKASLKDTFNYLKQMQLLEAIKAQKAIPDIEAHLKLGRKVVVFHDYNVGGGFNPFRPVGDLKKGIPPDAAAYDGYARLIAEKPEAENLNFEGLLPPVQALKKRFGDRAVIYNGTIPQKVRKQAKADFQTDGSGIDVIIVQSAAGEAGIDLHDTTGGHQRALINLGMPVRPTTALQEEGRTRREGSVTDAAFRYYTIGTAWERRAFAAKIAQRSGTVENLALGNMARTIRDSFIDSYGDAEPIQPEVGDGKGGKVKDRAQASASPYDVAKTHYYGRMKTTGRRDQRDGLDFYPTPEPLAFKMVEWAGIRAYERALEPSAGDGAIARYLPEHARRTIIEPSMDLLSKAELRASGSTAINRTFEDYHIANKHHAIVMNPPFGSGGKTAMDHLAKAMGHLKPGGRIVALVPTGPAADKRFEALWQSDIAKGFTLRGIVNLPAVAFEKAGTAVMSRVLIIDKVNAIEANLLGTAQRLNLTGIDKIGDLFDRLEDITLPARVEQRFDPTEEIDLEVDEDGEPIEQPIEVVAKPAKIGRPIADSLGNFKLSQTKHAVKGFDLFVATAENRVAKDAYNAALSVAKAHGGWYSYFDKNGAIPGFQFKSEAQRQAFLDDMGKPTTGMAEDPEAFSAAPSVFAADLKDELGLRDLSLYVTRNGDLKLNMIAVPRGKQGKGIGTRAMRRITAYADASGLRLILTAGQRDDGFGTTSRARLVAFYKRFGFIENKGRNKDYTISEGLYRPARVGFGEDAPAFFSPLHQAILGAKQAKASPSDWRAIIAKLPGVKRAEVEWLGVDEYLSIQEASGAKMVDRGTLADFIKAQEVRVEAMVLGDVEAMPPEPYDNVPEWEDATEDDAANLVDESGDFDEPDYTISDGEAIYPDDYDEEAEYYMDEARDELVEEAESNWDEDDGEFDPDFVSEDDVKDRAKQLAEERFEPREYDVKLYDRNGNWPEYEGVYDNDGRTYYFGDLPGSGGAGYDLDGDDAQRLARAVWDKARDEAIAKKLEELTAEGRNSQGQTREEFEDDIATAKADYEARMEAYRAENAGVIARNKAKGLAGASKWSSYTEPGGGEYREILLRVPNLNASGPNKDGKKPFVQSSHFSAENIVVHARVKDRVDAQGRRVLFVEEIQSDLATKWRDVKEDSPEQAAKRKALTTELAEAEKAERNAIEIAAAEFPKMHPKVFWWEAGSARTLETEKMGLFEVSRALKVAARWSADGRAQIDREKPQSLGEVFVALHDADAGVARLARTLTEAQNRSQRLKDELLALGTERKADPALPLSPWSDPEQYVLMVKHLLREAALKGYDKLSWTPGWMQARRWGKAITNVVQGVTWETAQTNSGPQRRVQLAMFGGTSGMAVNVDAETGNILSINADMNAEGVGDPLSRLIGGPVARQVLEKEEGEVDGQRITFGTSGYAIAYDGHVKRTVEKLVRKFGGAVVEDRTIPDFASSSRNGPREARYLGFRGVVERAVRVGIRQQYWADRMLELEGTDAEVDKVNILLRNEFTEEDMRTLFPDAATNEAVWSVEISPEIRQGASAPQALFQRPRLPSVQSIIDEVDQKAAAQKVGEIKRALKAELERLDLKRVKLGFKGGVDWQGMFLREVDGSMFVLIGAAHDPMATLHHEVIHVMKEMNLFTEAEWAALERAAVRWMDKHDIRTRYPSLTYEQQLEEAIAEEFAESFAKKQAPRGSILITAFNKIIRIFKAIRNAAQGLGFQTAEDIFGRALSGEISARQKAWDRGPSPDRGAAMVKADAFKRWFGKSKVVDAAGKPLQVYHGTKFDGDISIFLPMTHFGTARAAGQRINHKERFIPEEKASGERLYPVYLSMEKPLEMGREQGFGDNGEWVDDSDMIRQIGKTLGRKGETMAAERLGALAEDVYKERTTPVAARTQTAEILAELGYDGLTYTNIVEDSSSVSYVPLRGEQVKSTFNRGTFDPADPRISFQKARLPSKQARAHMATPMGGQHLHIPDRNIWQELSRAGAPIWQRLRGGAGAARDAVDRARVVIQDRMLPLRRAQFEIEKLRGSPLPSAMDAYTVETTFSGKVGRHLFEIDEDFTKPIVTLIAQTRGRLTAESVGTWLYARHAIERNARIASINPRMPDGGSGMMDADAQAILAAAAASPDAATLDKIGTLVDQLRERSLILRQNKGLITATEANRWRTQYKHYVPLKGWADTDLSDSMLDVSGVGRRFNTRGQESRMALGRSSEAFNPLQAIITQAQEVAIRAEKNAVGQAVIELAKAHPSPALWSIKQIKMKQVFNRTTGLVEMRPEDPLTLFMEPNEMAVKVSGQEYRITFHDPRLARALGQVGADQMNGVMRFLSMLSRFFSMTRTMLNPEFMITNAFRDFQTAQFGIQALGINPKTKADDRAAIAAAMAANWRRALAGVYRGQGNKTNTTWSRYFSEFQKAGAGISFWTLDQPEAAVHDLDKRINLARGNRAARMLKHLRPSAVFNMRDNPALAFIERANLAVDNAIRLAAFIKARELGWEVQDAAFLAKELTVNFNRRGETTSSVNALYPFFNAAIQGSVRVGKALVSRRVAIMATVAVGAGVVLDLVNASLSDEDDDGELFYDKIPEYRNERNLHFVLGGTGDNPVAMPMPYGFNIFPYAGQQIGKWLRGVQDPSESFGNVMVATFGAFSPVSGGTPETMVAPFFADPFVEMAQNENFAGNTIYPAYPKTGTPDSQTFYPSATLTSRWAAEALNAVTGGDFRQPGLIDVSPETLDHLSAYVFGSAGAFWGRTTDVMGKVMSGNTDQIEQQDIPFLRTVTTPITKWVDLDRYRQFSLDVKDANADAKAYVEAGMPVPAEIQAKANLYEAYLAAERELDGKGEWNQTKEGALTPRDERAVWLDFNRKYLLVTRPRTEQ